jgi:uncharacterized membrane protein
MRWWWLIVAVACGGSERGGRSERGARAPTAQEAARPREAVEEARPNEAVAPAVAPAALREPVVVHGVVVREGEALRYTPCDGGAAVALVDASGVLAPLWRSLGDRVVARGGGAKEAGGVRLERADAVAPAGEAACGALPDAEWLASGTEPFWGMQVRGDKVVFTQPDEPARVEVVVTRELDSWRSVPGAKGWHPLELTVAPTPCTDGMSGAWASHTATAKFDGRELKGCASPVVR